MADRDPTKKADTGQAVQPAPPVRWKRLGPRCYVLYLGVPRYFLSYKNLRDYASRYHIALERTIYDYP